MLDALITGAVVGLFALAGNVAGALIISHQLAQPAHGPAGTLRRCGNGPFDDRSGLVTAASDLPLCLPCPALPRSSPPG